ncbi:exo-beta-N-acetylmuramidase NamZ family protein [Mucilaginibacter ginsenosidivorans]|uniref:DUF1343 domain-containing protein n=1 Tax=Mucilaginibacter ginsenosidivorans TaxID=398053 RepID=A0A5B8V342_9SPHI|nr:DUF1343 domain-containing protein [Mucilaginibacter ginsenosidivorans]QEC64976.1 DUF1343 domain-containing protein [Mucilaginibacter ginsenosidivorans]
MKRYFFVLFMLLSVNSLIAAAQHQAKAGHKTRAHKSTVKTVLPGADQTGLYLGYLKNKNIGMVINQTSVIGRNHVSSLDSLVKLGVHIVKIFGPEHGFRGTASNGATVNDTVDPKTGIPAISLYGKHYKPTPDDLKGLDLVVFDIQDVGTRFYTYLSTLHYVMEACAENHVELMILDRPNPNGNYVDGPVLDTAYRSFVGLDAIPIVHGMTFGEYAQMLNGEGWLKGHVQCKLRIIKVAHYTHATTYIPPVNPSPNLNTYNSIVLYPSLCLFEGTTLSLGRGTLFPFQVLGHPLFKGKFRFSFTPESIPGMSEDPPQKGKICYGIDMRNYDPETIRSKGKIDILWLIKLYKEFPDKEHFFNNYFTKLAGNTELRKQIEEGKSDAEIRKSWEPALSNFKTIRKKYLLYK